MFVDLYTVGHDRFIKYRIVVNTIRSPLCPTPNSNKDIINKD